MSDRTAQLDALVRRLLARADDRPRTIVGIAGSPGSGKSTLAAALVQRLGSIAAALPLDGFHLSNAALDRLGRRDRKGAIDTFDAAGWVALISRVRTEGDTVWAPGFERRVDEPIAASVAVAPEHRIVIAEGNYLLVPEHPWSDAAAALDERWFCSTPERMREARLVERHRAGGRSAEAALAWAREVDGRNAETIEATAGRADLLVSGEDWRVLPTLAD